MHDRFRGRIHCGVHITRIDVIRGMRQALDALSSEHNLEYVLHNEAFLRNIALRELGPHKQFKGFRILHDHFQHYADIFAKYALRELRGRTDFGRRRLEACMARWDGETDFQVARAGIRHAERTVPPGTDPPRVDAYIRDLPRIARREVAKMGLADRPVLTMTQEREALG